MWVFFFQGYGGRWLHEYKYGLGVGGFEACFSDSVVLDVYVLRCIVYIILAEH